ncbi:hypothetical protein [Clostridium paraputrificum]|uniref:Uncharacterized protein n=1 Tax=Clostridium paraputrificum TaxID=29363 RepID=A0A6N3GNS1_9CLOT
MRVKNNLTPYPILSNYTDDYINSKYSVNINSSVEFDKINIDFCFELENEYIKKLIEDGKAAYAIHVECPVTSYRYSIQSNKDIHISIPSDLVKSQIEVCTFIIAQEKIPNFYCNQFNHDYGNTRFDVRKGSKLAISEMAIINIIKNRDKLKDTEGIIKIRKSESSSLDYVKYDLDNDYIIITLPQKLYELYIEHGRQGFKNTMVATLIFPVIIQALTKMKCENSEDNDIENYKWYISLKSVLRDNNIEVDNIEILQGSGKKSIFKIAQSILQKPIEKMMTEINRYGGENYD